MEKTSFTDRQKLFLDLLKELRLLPDKKLTIMDGRVVKFSPHASSVSCNDVVHQFFINISLRDHLACEKLILRDQIHDNSSESPFSSADVLFAILTQSDSLLLQDLLRKMTICKIAVPILLPDPSAKCVTFSLWGLRKCSSSHQVNTTENKINFPEHPFLTISVLRIGKNTISKSDILNKLSATLIGVSRGEHFRPFLEEKPKSIFGNGIVEGLWLVDTFNEDNKKRGIPVCIMNVRGDAHEHMRQMKFCSLTSSILIIFAEIKDTWKELNQLLTISMASHFIMLSSSTDVALQIPSGKKVKRISIESLSEIDISLILFKSISTVIRKCTISKPLTEQTDLCKNLKITTDEETPVCKTAKLIANEISTEIKTIHTEWSKDILFPLLMMKRDWGTAKHTDRGDRKDYDYFELFQAEKTLRENQRKRELSELTMRIICAILEDENIGIWLILWLEMLFDEMETCYTKSNEIPDIAGGVDSQVEHTFQWHTSMVNRDMFLGELQEVVECSKLVSTETDPSKLFSKHSKIFAKLLLHGHSLHITDCNSNFVSATWIRSVFKDLHEVTRGTGIRVVSILGGYKSGKSKLLNQLFGVDFPEGSEKRSAGLRLYLVPMETGRKTAIPFDFLLVIDTEGLNVNEKSNSSYESRNSFVSMMATALSDITVIHICSKQSLSDVHEIISIIKSSVEQTEESGKFPKICVVYQRGSGQNSKVREKENKGQGQSERADLFKDFDYRHGEKSDSFVLWKDVRVIDMLKFSQTINSMTSYTGISLSSFRLQLIQLVSNSEKPVLHFNEFGEKVVELFQTFQRLRFINIHSLSEKSYSPLKELHELFKELQVNVEKHADNACKLIQDAPYDRVHDTLEENLLAMTVLNRRNTLIVEKTFKDQLQKLDGNLPYKESLSKTIEDMKSGNESRIKSLRRQMLKVRDIRRGELLSSLRKRYCHKYVDHDTLIESEIDNFLLDITLSGTPNDWNEMSEQEYHEKWNKFIEENRGKYPVIELNEQQKTAEHQVISLLEELGYDLQEIATNKSFHDCARSSYTFSTEEDLFKVNENFHIVSDENEKLMTNLLLELEALCKKETDFAIRTEGAVDLFRRFDEESDLPVDRVTLFTFLCSQYISKVHATNLEEESRLTEFNRTNRPTPMSDVNHSSDNQCDIKHTELMQYPNLTSKIENVLFQVGKFFTDEEISMLKHSLNEQTVQNYTHLPFNCTTLQRLDIYFHSLLPALSKYDMENVNSVVDDAKMFILGKVLARANLDLSKELNNVFASIEKDLKRKHESTAAVYHISSWSVPLISIKLRRDKEEQSFAKSIERLGNITLAKYLCNINVTSDVLLADILCEEIEHSVLRFVEDHWVKQFTERTFSLKKTLAWKENVIRRMLFTLCQQNDFENLIDFIQNYRHLGKVKFIKVVANIFNEKGNSHIHSFAEDIIREKIKQCLSALDETAQTFEIEKGRSLAFWLHIFLEKMSTYSVQFLREKHLDILKKCTKVSNFTTFTRQCERKVLELNSRIKSLLQLPPEGNTDSTVTWFYEMPCETYMTLIREIKGCTNQCPLCGAICEYGVQDHEFHRTALHYPMCFNGRKYRTSQGTWNLDITVCSKDSVNEYRDKMKEWKITQGTSEPMTYWKYMVHRFSLHLQQFYNCVALDIPSVWYKVSQSDALKSIHGDDIVTPGLH